MWGKLCPKQWDWKDFINSVENEKQGNLRGDNILGKHCLRLSVQNGMKHRLLQLQPMYTMYNILAECHPVTAPNKLRYFPLA